jgi:hypothetical protein
LGAIVRASGNRKAITKGSLSGAYGEALHIGALA